MSNTSSTQLPQEFNSLLELIEYFSDETKCMNYLMAQRWDGAINCPHCGNQKVYAFSDGIRYKCSACRQQFTAKVGTIFEGSKIPMKKWFVAIYLVTSHKKGISSHQLAKDLKVTQKTAWFMLHRIRFALGQGSFEMPMGDDGGIVEIDETYVGGKESNKHESKKTKNKENGYGKSIVMGIVERQGSIRTFVIPNTEAKTMRGVITNNVSANASIVTDAHNSYKKLWELYERHTMIKSTLHDYKTKGDIHTNTIEGYWSLLKRSIIGIYHYVSPKHLQAYCDETAYRYNTRTSNEGNRVTLTLTKSNKRLTYNTLISK